MGRIRRMEQMGRTMTVMEKSWMRVTVKGWGNSVRIHLPKTPLQELTAYHIRQMAATRQNSRTSLPSILRANLGTWTFSRFEVRFFFFQGVERRKFAIISCSGVGSDLDLEMVIHVLWSRLSFAYTIHITKGGLGVSIA